MIKESDPTKDWSVIKFTGADIFLPNSPGVYIVTGDNDYTTYNRFIYIGEASDLKKRWKNGHNQALACIREGADEIRYFITDKYKALESRLIAHYRPTLNNWKLVNSCLEKHGDRAFVFDPEEW